MSEVAASPAVRSKRTWLGRWIDRGIVLLAATGLVAWGFGATALAQILAVTVVLLLLGRLGILLLRRLLYRVSRQLAFSYLLMGILPIPMVLLLVGLTTWAAGGILAGRLYRSALEDLTGELAVLARAELGRSDRLRADDGFAGARLARYRDGVKVAGHRSLPSTLPAWLEDSSRALATIEGRPTPVALARDHNGGAILAVWGGHDLQAELATRAGVWGRFESWDSSAGRRSNIMIQVGQLGFTWGELQQWRRSAPPPLGFFDPSPDSPWFRRPLLRWADLLGSTTPLAAAEAQDSHVGVLLTATPEVVYRRLFASAGEIDLAAWAVLFLIAFLLFDIYLIALGMAIFVVVGVSRAVNHLSRATDAVVSGDFGTRIPVRRRDQLGDLQRSFNEMTVSLQRLVSETAEKESLEKELELARQVQRSLLPEALEVGDGVEFASSFEPSAAIGGDYFDILRLGKERLAVVIADVSGHGLSAGLRMAMVKAALEMLVEHNLAPTAILARLHRMVRAQRLESGGRSMVTATLAIVDLPQGTLELVNAGHAPTWIVRADRVDEIVLPGPPLGGIGERYGCDTVPLGPGDLVVFLSDGLIEALDADDEAFGYDGITNALQGLGGRTATEVRDQLLHAIAGHTRGRPIEDDRTLLVLRLLGKPAEPRPAG